MNAASGTASSEPAAYVLPFPGSHAERSSTSSWSANVSLSRANCMRSDAASQGGGWWQGCGAAHILASSCTGTFSYSPLGVRHLCSDVQKVIIRRVKACHTWRSR